jgi:hypothetical protein
MRTRPWIDSRIQFFGKAGIFLSLVGAVAGMFITLVRVPALAQTKLEVLLGTLQAGAFTLLFVIFALLIYLTLVVHQATRQPNDPCIGGGTEVKRQPSPGA